MKKNYDVFINEKYGSEPTVARVGGLMMVSGVFGGLFDYFFTYDFLGILGLGGKGYGPYFVLVALGFLMSSISRVRSSLFRVLLGTDGSAQYRSLFQTLGRSGIAGQPQLAVLLGHVRDLMKDLSETERLERKARGSSYTEEERGKLEEEIAEKKKCINENVSKIANIDQSDVELELKQASEAISVIERFNGQPLGFVNHYFCDAAYRLTSEKNTLSLRTFMNLLIGFLVACVGLWMLYDLNSHLSLESAGTTVSRMQIGARLMLVIMVEIVAFFFLNLYRVGLHDLKYCQNEITNVLLIQASCIGALQSEEREIASEILRTLSKTERNFVLKKGESLIGHRQSEIDQDGYATAFQSLQGLVPLSHVQKGPKAAKRTRSR